MRSKFTTASLLALLFMAATFLGPMSPSTTAGQTSGKKAAQSKTEKDHAQKGRGAGGADSNIKNDSDANDPSKQMPAPGAKGGEKGKGQGDCVVVLDNRSPWYIRIYVDGNYRGTIAPWGDSYCYTGAGETLLYAVAPFTDGTKYTWGPRSVSCFGRYTWQLYP